jgi:hypothetical protein
MARYRINGMGVRLPSEVRFILAGGCTCVRLKHNLNRIPTCYFKASQVINKWPFQIKASSLVPSFLRLSIDILVFESSVMPYSYTDL